VCPIRDGGGTKLKLLDAFAMQKCVIAHPIACEGIEVTPGRDVEFAESTANFVGAIRRLLCDPAEREPTGRAARQLVVERYSFAEIVRTLCAALESAAPLSSPVDGVRKMSTVRGREGRCAGPDRLAFPLVDGLRITPRHLGIEGSTNYNTRYLMHGARSLRGG
jgi:hypothetical protein